ncbi:MAG: M20 family metallopeptidase [Clostridiales bacterium]|nr:M20 family metallopeptidase [Clostridiales bacterium]
MQHPMQKYFDEIVQSISRIIQFDSSFKGVEGEHGEFPFGKETADCLQYFLSLAESFGFETHNYDNYVGEVVFGDGEEFAILAHLDVVPAGNGWKYPPFGGVVNDDVSVGGVTGKKIWGRGAMDDKGPAVVCLYALKALKDEGFVPHRKIKLIVGCNEECGNACIAHYKEVAHMPDEGFTPDANFPVIYAEKGIAHITASFPINNSPVTALVGGERANMVCDYVSAFLTKKGATALVDYQNPIANTTISYDNTTNVLQTRGKSAHGSTPDKGANALQTMLAFLATINDDFAYAYDVLFNDSLGLKIFQDETGVLTISPDVARLENGVLKVTADIRFPATFALQSITDRFDEAGIDYQISSYLAPLYNDVNSRLISTLTRVYNNATGKQETPIAIGGGTYARALKCGCAFGPEINGEETSIHQPNEYITFDRIQFIGNLYYDAIKELTKPQYIRIGYIKARRITK